MSYTIRNTTHKPQFDWGDSNIQGGEQGVVGSDDGVYVTAFIEVFPKSPHTFIRAEANTVAEAERIAWKKYQRILSCEEHKFERKGYTNGCGICVHCDLFMSGIFEPTEICTICGGTTFWTMDKENKFYCEEHESHIPKDLQYPWHKNKKY